MAAKPVKKPVAGASKGGAKKTCKKINAPYNNSGEKIERKNRFCPKCGPGTFMGVHSNRLVCGKCAYVEIKKN